MKTVNFKKILKEFHKAWREHLLDEEHWASGKLGNEMTFDTYIDRNGYHITITLPEYAAYLNDGTKPHWPPVDKIREWIKVKPVLPRPGRNGKLPSTEQLAYLIGRKISKVGTKPTKIIDRTINDFDLINKLVSHLEQELAKELSEL